MLQELPALRSYGNKAVSLNLFDKKMEDKALMDYCCPELDGMVPACAEKVQLVVAV